MNLSAEQPCHCRKLCVFSLALSERERREIYRTDHQGRGWGVTISGRRVLASEESYHWLPRTYSTFSQSRRPGTGRKQMAPSKVGKIVHKGVEKIRKQELSEKGIKLPESKNGGIIDGKILGL